MWPYEALRQSEGGVPLASAESWSTGLLAALVRAQGSASVPRLVVRVPIICLSVIPLA